MQEQGLTPRNTYEVLTSHLNLLPQEARDYIVHCGLERTVGNHGNLQARFAAVFSDKLKKGTFAYTASRHEQDEDLDRKLGPRGDNNAVLLSARHSPTISNLMYGNLHYANQLELTSYDAILDIMDNRGLDKNNASAAVIGDQEISYGVVISSLGTNRMDGERALSIAGLWKAIGGVITQYQEPETKEEALRKLVVLLNIKGPTLGTFALSGKTAEEIVAEIEVPKTKEDILKIACD